MHDYNDSDEEIDRKQHAKLLEKVLSLNKRPQLKKPTRTEPTLKVSEYNLVKSITGKQGTIHLNELTKALKKRAKHVEISKKVRNTERRAKTLPKPLEKPQAQRIKRNLVYQNVVKQLDRWDNIVAKNRSAHHLPFPIPPKLQLYTTGETIKEFNTRNNPDGKQYPLSMEEILERRKDIAKMRAVQSYKEAKARRQSKIKSKKYHRVQRKQKIKDQIKEFEHLQKTNPEEALKKLEEIERARAEERASLRHHSTGKWAQSKQVRAKYDKESRQVLAQQLSISRDLKQKLQKNDTESEEDEPINTNATPELNDTLNNPWTNPIQPQNEVVEFMESYKKFWEKVDEKVKKPNVQTDLEQPVENILNASVDAEKDEEIMVNDPPLQNHRKEKRSKKDKRSKDNSKITIKKNKVRKLNKGIRFLGTSEWDVNSFSSDEDDVVDRIAEPLDLDNAFDEYEEKLKNKIKDKYKDLKASINVNGQVSKSVPQKTKKVKRKKTTEHKPKDDRINIDEGISKSNENINSDLQALKAVLSNSEKVVDSAKTGTIKTKAVDLNTEIPDLFSLDDNEETANQKGTISEAFEDDDIVEEFQKEKQAEINSEKPEDIDLALPGWGSWGGVGIKPSKRKNKRLLIKFPKEFKRRDDNKDDVFINEKADKKIKKHMVSEVPFPFRNVKDFEASIRAPIGETFVPDLAFKKMIKPAVTTKMGAIIEPMSEDILIDG